MQRQDSWNLDEDDCPQKTRESNFTCDECGKAFQKPILATISASGQSRTYYACPRCLTNVRNMKAPTKEKEEKGPVLTEEEPPKPPQESNDSSCTHSFGYLKKHEKSMPFPDECLTCPKMVECLRH